jgi:hypothetical protein
MKNGNGTWKSPTGDFYSGQWVFNKQEGYGIHKYNGIKNN